MTLDGGYDKEIVWTKRKRPAAKYEGHDIRRTGDRHVGYFKYRGYLECECGKVFSAGSAQPYPAGPFYAWTRHRKELGLKEVD